jgi:hypothetical protein
MLFKSILSTSTKNPMATCPLRARLHFNIPILIILQFALFNFQSCGLDVEDPTPPSPPVWVEKSLPEEWPERGIDAHENDRIFLEWKLNPEEENVTSYHIYRARYFDALDSLSDFSLISTHSLSQSPIPEFVDSEISLNVLYSYKLLAEDISGGLSNFSDTLEYTLLPSIYSATMIPNQINESLGANRQLQWRYTYLGAMENYTITLLDTDNNLILRHEFSPGNYIGRIEYFYLPDSTLLINGENYKWRVDMGAQYVSSKETAGSESHWATFIYVED